MQNIKYLCGKFSKQVSACYLALVILSAIVFPAGGKVFAATLDTIEYDVPGPAGAGPSRIILGPDGNMWFTQNNGNVGQITPSGAITQYPVVLNSSPKSLAFGPDGRIWYAGYNYINSMTTSGVNGTQIFAVLCDSEQMIFGPDDNMWTANANSANGVCQTTTAGVSTRYDEPHGGIFSITNGPDGRIWYTETNPSFAIVAMTTAGVATHYPVSSQSGGFRSLSGITVGSDGNLWFTNAAENNIGRMTPTGDLTTFPLPTADFNPLSATLGGDGNIWFTGTSKIGKITPSGVITEYDVPEESSRLSIAAGPNNTIWYVQTGTSKIVTFTIPEEPPAPQPEPGPGPAPTPPTNGNVIVPSAPPNTGKR